MLLLEVLSQNETFYLIIQKTMIYCLFSCSILLAFCLSFDRQSEKHVCVGILYFLALLALSAQWLFGVVCSLTNNGAEDEEEEASTVAS